MKKCPNCNEESEDNFDICWNCNFNFIEEKTTLFENDTHAPTQINCLRCNIPMKYSGKHKIHEGTFNNEFIFKSITLDIFKCPKCKKIEFFSFTDDLLNV